MNHKIGLNVIEVDGRAAPSIQPAPTSVAAFIIRAPKGVPGRVEQVTNWTQFTERFGGYMDQAYGAYAVRGFFDNGGSMAYVTRVMPSSGDNAAVPSSTTLVDSEGAVALTVKAGYLGLEYPGEWGNDIAIQITTNEKDDTTYDLTVQHKVKVIETWEQLDNSGATDRDPEEVINDDPTGSKYIKVEKAADNPKNPANTVDDSGNPIFVSLADGLDGKFTDPSLGADAKEALPLFDVYEMQLLCCPETVHANWVGNALPYCSNRGDCMFVGHTPREFKSVADIKDYVENLRGDKVYGALYYPWIMVSDPDGNPIWIPPTGHILGVYARTERERGIWKAPAGNAARLNGALDVKWHITDAEHTNLVKDNNVNAVRFIPGQGIVIDSSRSLSTSPLWLYVNIRLLFNFVKSSLKAGLRWVVQEPNDETLWNKVKYNSVTPFLMGLWRRGAFGSGSPEQVFTVKVDAENNLLADIQQGRLTIEVYFYPSRPAETIVIIVGQQEGGATANEG